MTATQWEHQLQGLPGLFGGTQKARMCELLDTDWIESCRFPFMNQSLEMSTIIVNHTMHLRSNLPSYVICRSYIVGIQ